MNVPSFAQELRAPGIIGTQTARGKRTKESEPPRRQDAKSEQWR
jgi:hypothetical protein